MSCVDFRALPNYCQISPLLYCKKIERRRFSVTDQRLPQVRQRASVAHFTTPTSAQLLQPGGRLFRVYLRGIQAGVPSVAPAGSRPCNVRTSAAHAGGTS